MPSSWRRALTTDAVPVPEWPSSTGARVAGHRSDAREPRRSAARHQLGDRRSGMVNNPSELFIKPARSTSSEVLCFATTLWAELAHGTAGCGSSGQDSALSVRPGPRTETTRSVPHVQNFVPPVPEIDDELQCRVYPLRCIEERETIASPLASIQTAACMRHFPWTLPSRPLPPNGWSSIPESGEKTAGTTWSRCRHSATLTSSKPHGG